MENVRYDGKVLFFLSHYGFIAWSKEGVAQTDMFVHYSDINASGFRKLKEDQLVSFEIGTNHDGKPKAINVIICDQK